MTRKVLIVDDEPDIVEVMEFHVSKLGYAVDTAADGEVAITLLNDNEYAFVITDLDMPRKTGVDVISFIRAHRPYLPVAICSGRINEYAERLVSIAANVALPKPFKFGDLELAVAQLQGISDKVGQIREFMRPIQVGDVMAKEPISVTPQCLVEKVLGIMDVNKIGAVAVVDNGVLKGIFTERDVLHRVAIHTPLFMTTAVAAFMTKDPFVVSPNSAIDEADRLMTTNHIRHLPVVEGKELVGMLSLRDVSTYHVSRLDRKFAAQLVGITTMSLKGAA